MSLSRNKINSWLSNIDIQGKSVLDVGSGKKTKQARDYTKGKPKKYVMLDVNKEVEPDIVMDLNEDGWLGEEFDIVFCLETLEHCWNPINAIEKLYRMLKMGGTCYISVPFINPIHDTWDMLRFTNEWFEKVLPIVGFKKVEIERRIATNGLESLMDFYKLEGMRMSKIRLKNNERHKIGDIGYCIIAYK